MHVGSSKQVLLILTCLGVLVGPVIVMPGVASGNPTASPVTRSAPVTSWQGFGWGWNGNGRLGTGSLDDSATAPVATGAGDNATDRWMSIDAGYNHSCGIGTDGHAYCWGANFNGQLGNGTLSDDSLPEAVSGGDTWTAVSAGGGFFLGTWKSHSCGVTSSGSAYCWGANDQGQLGLGTPPGPDQLTPQAVSGGLLWRSISAGGNHTCAIAPDDRGYCWGDNSEGQLGFGQETDFEVTPTLIAGAHSWKSISAGRDYSCGVTTGGQGYCWGRNNSAQLGLGTSGNTDDSRPARVLDGANGSSTWGSIAAGHFYTCGTSASAAAFCWGDNFYGQLGNGTTSNSSIPVAVLPPMNAHVQVVEPATNSEMTCGITATNAYCWGYNDSGSLGNPAYQDDTSVPLAVAPTWQAPGIVPQSLSVGGDFSFLLVGPHAPDPGPDPSPDPASPPRLVEAVPADRSALVSWAAPASPGSYPVTYYQATSIPGGQACLTTSLSCTVTGLTNGTPYTFTVRALTGAGWSATSDASNAVTPQAVPRSTIRITGMREGKRIVVAGTTTGFGTGAELVGWVRFRGGEFERQRGRILVDDVGTFTWERRTRRPAVVYVSTPDGSVLSNRVVIPAR